MSDRDPRDEIIEILQQKIELYEEWTADLKASREELRAQCDELRAMCEQLCREASISQTSCQPAHPDQLDENDHLEPLGWVPDRGKSFMFDKWSDALNASIAYRGEDPVQLPSGKWITRLGDRDPDNARFWAQLYYVVNPRHRIAPRL